MKNLHRSQLAWAALALALAAGSLVAQDGDAAARKPQLLAEALKARDEGNLQAAKAKFEAILAIDAKDVGATEGLSSVNASIAEAEASKKAADAAKAAAEAPKADAPKADAPKADAPAPKADAPVAKPVSALEEVAAVHEKLFAEVTQAIELARKKSAAGDHKGAIELLDSANGALPATAAAQKLRDTIALTKQDVVIQREYGPKSYSKIVAESVSQKGAELQQIAALIKKDVITAESLIRKGTRKDIDKALEILTAYDKNLDESVAFTDLKTQVTALKASANSRAALVAMAEGDFVVAQRKIDDYKLIQDAELARSFREEADSIKLRHSTLRENNASTWSKLEESLDKENEASEVAIMLLRKAQIARNLKDDTVSAKLQKELDQRKKNSLVRGIDELSPGIRVKDDKVNELLVKGRARYLYGDYQGALDAYREVLQYQPNNSESKAYQIRIRQMLSENSGQWNRGVTKGKLLELLDETWKLPEVFNRENIKVDTANGNDPIVEKMKAIQLPEGFVVRDQPLDRALALLQTSAASYDKDQKGINVVLIDPANKNPTVSLQLRNVSVYQALDYICKRVGFSFSVGSGGIIEVREDSGDSLLETEIYPLSTAAVLKMTGLSAGGTGAAAGGAGGAAANPFGGAAAGGAGAGDGQRPEEVAIRNFLTRSGVAFEAPATLSYDGTNLIVYQSRKNLDRVKNIIRRYSDIKQVHIEAKFMEVEQKILNELGVNWTLAPTAGGTGNVNAASNLRSIANVFQSNNSAARALTVNDPANGLSLSNIQNAPSFPGGANLGGATGNSYSGTVGILGAETLAVAIRAIEQNSGSDLMSSPSLTVLDGKTAVIKVAQLLRYPQAYGDTQSNVGTASTAGAGGGASTSVAITAGTPQDFTVQEVGVTLEVTPTVAADDSIALNLKPKVTEFEGFVEYGGTSIAISGTTTVSVPSGFFQPIFSTREVTTDVTVFDGATVVIGGLTREEVKTVDDKVPVLGSIPLIGAAFRSTGKTIQKKSLMVFVTANLVSPGGATLRSTHPGMRAGSTFSNPTLISPGGAVYREPIEAAAPAVAPPTVVTEPAK